MKVLNECTRDVIFVGAGESKNEVLSSLFDTVHLRQACPIFHGNEIDEVRVCDVIMNSNLVYPCGMIRPERGILHYLTDSDATKNNLQINKNSCSML